MSDCIPDVIAYDASGFDGIRVFIGLPLSGR